MRRQKANIFMESFESIAITTFKRPPKIWKRYVDDTFAILSKYVERCSLIHINNINEAIQFAVESEDENGEQPFLDCLIKKNPDGTLDTTVYRKPKNTGRYLNFHSYRSSATKRGFIKGLFRAERLCSTPDLLKTEMERIYSSQLNHSYPKKFIDCVKTRITNQAPLERNWTSTVCIPYVPRISDAIRRTLSPEGFRVAFADPRQRLNY